MLKISVMCASVLVMSGAVICSPFAASAENKTWSVTLGAGAIYAPNYEGSGTYELSPIPYLNVEWGDTVTFGREGLSIDVVENDTSTYGVGITFDGGRDEDGSSLFRRSDDDRLLGMGDIDTAVGVRLYGSHDFQPATLSGSVTKFLGDDNDGILATVNLSKRMPFSRQLFVTPSVSATWADEQYTQVFFGVNAQQAARSRFSRYTADAGLKDVNAGVNILYLVNQNVFVTVNARVQQLTGDAASGPISEDDTSASLVSAVGYRF